MRLEILHPAAPEGVDPGILPNVRPMAPTLTKLEVVYVGTLARFEGEDEFVTGAVEGTHAGIGLCPNNQVFEIGIDSVGGFQKLLYVAPVHANEMDRTI